jgi:hypothetical protein
MLMASILGLKSKTPKEGRSSYTCTVKEDFKTKLLTRNNEGHFILIKGTIHQGKITVLNIHDK